ELAGNIPAVIAEAVNRAKLSQIRLNPKGVSAVTITPEAMLDAAKSMKMQMQLLQREQHVEPSDLEKAAAIVAHSLRPREAQPVHQNGKAGDAVLAASAK